ncbi:MAG: J domain-containing protein [Acaryochloridaceae cyanobacterium CSU_3_4]|nr:J domain-containing protein [Acaryochloridaceae cyanobacterium CSU_3_4]
MSGCNHYQILEVDPAATSAEIKRAYHRLAKLFHPDSQHQMANHERIAQVNAAYEVLKDPQRRLIYDQTQNAKMENYNSGKSSASSTATHNPIYPTPKQTARDTEVQLQRWLKQVYHPVNHHLAHILNSLSSEIQYLSADPYDDDLIADFQDYLADCRTRLQSAQAAFQSCPNPDNIASVAAHLYYCLNHIEDGLEDLERFTYCYEDSYLTTGRELFCICQKLCREAQGAMSAVF